MSFLSKELACAVGILGLVTAKAAASETVQVLAGNPSEEVISAIIEAERRGDKRVNIDVLPLSLKSFNSSPGEGCRTIEAYAYPEKIPEKTDLIYKIERCNEEADLPASPTSPHFDAPSM